MVPHRVLTSVGVLFTDPDMGTTEARWAAHMGNGRGPCFSFLRVDPTRVAKKHAAGAGLVQRRRHHDHHTPLCRAPARRFVCRRLAARPAALQGYPSAPPSLTRRTL